MMLTKYIFEVKYRCLVVERRLDDYDSGPPEYIRSAARNPLRLPRTFVRTRQRIDAQLGQRGRTLGGGTDPDELVLFPQAGVAPSVGVAQNARTVASVLAVHALITHNAHDSSVVMNETKTVIIIKM